MSFIEISTCNGHNVTFMSPLMPLEVNIDSRDPVVKDRMAFLSCSENQKGKKDTLD